MQIVIDIKEEDYRFIHEYKFVPEACILSLGRAIPDGTPLPKGHGRIGDLDALLEEVSSWGMNDYEPLDFIDAIDQADTIIEADKEQEDE